MSTLRNLKNRNFRRYLFSNPLFWIMVFAFLWSVFNALAAYGVIDSPFPVEINQSTEIQE